MWNGTSPDGFVGQMWMRTTVTLTAEQAAKPGAVLDLGAVNEEDETWINGKDVGASSFANRTQHSIRAGVLKEGVNVIATNIFCSWRNCGIRGPAENRAIRFGDGTSAVLSNPWKYQEVPDTRIAPQLPWGPTHGVTMDFNGMVSPIGAYGFRGVVWYQGESDIYFAREYKTALLALMADWRRQFEHPELPFLIVQLPNYGPASAQPTASVWADVREAQRQAVLEDKHAALTVNVDIGDATNLHPTNKAELGRRLALAARNVVYGERIPPSGPVVASVRRLRSDVVVTFRDVTGALSGRGDQPSGFELCGASQSSCHPADMRVEGATVVLRDTGSATRVRYCWGDTPVCSVSDGSHRPAGPFEAAIRSRRKILQLALMAPVLPLRRQLQDLAPTVSKVYPGPDGKLVYVPDEQGNTILDSSHAGYGGGGVPIPTVPVKETIWPVAGDNTEHVQAAIDRISALPLDKYGFRGALVLRAGYYRMATPITIKASGVVLRGEGMGDTGTILIGTGTGRRPPCPVPAPPAVPARRRRPGAAAAGGGGGPAVASAAASPRSSGSPVRPA